MRQKYLHAFCFLLFSFSAFSQVEIFKEGKWGVKSYNEVVIPAVFDTVFGFEKSGKVCMACFRIKGVSANKFIRVTTLNYSCNYLNEKNERLIVANRAGDTCSVFSLGRNTIKSLNESKDYFSVSLNDQKHLVDKDFRQYTFKGYHNIALSADPEFYHVDKMVASETVYSGLIDKRETIIVPFIYSGIKINIIDSLIIACSAGLGNNAEDVIYNYNGEKIGSYGRHIDMATTNFTIHKLFEPKLHYIILNLKTKEEKILLAEEVNYYEADEIIIKLRNDRFIYNMNNHQKKPFKQTKDEEDKIGY
jgi:hypothetical protein